MLTGPLIVKLIDTKSQTFLYIHCKVGYQPKRYIKGFKELVQIRNMVLTFCLLVSSADNIYKQYGPRSGPTKRRA